MALSDILGANFPAKHVVIYSDPLASVEIARVAWPAFTAIVAGAARSVSECEFPEAEESLTVYCWGIMTAAEDGERLYYDLLRNDAGVPTPVDIEAGESPSFEPAGITLYEAPLWGEFLPGDESSMYGSKAILTTLSIPAPVASGLRFVVAPRVG